MKEEGKKDQASPKEQKKVDVKVPDVNEVKEEEKKEEVDEKNKEEPKEESKDGAEKA